MKKVFLALAAVTLIVAASSCNKQQKCQCTYKIGSLSYETDVFLSSEDKTCKDYEKNYNFADVDCHRVY